MFVTTANTLNICLLWDRMEVIRISGYTEDEKVNISKKYLPKQIKNNGLKKDEWSINDKEIRSIIRNYTRESGKKLRERTFQIARKIVRN